MTNHQRKRQAARNKVLVGGTEGILKVKRAWLGGLWASWDSLCRASTRVAIHFPGADPLRGSLNDIGVTSPMVNLHAIDAVADQVADSG